MDFAAVPDSLVFDTAVAVAVAGAAGESAHDSDPNNWTGVRANNSVEAIAKATATQTAAVDVAANTAANAYFTTVFTAIGADRNNVDNYFTNVILPNFGGVAQAAPAGGANTTSGQINAASSSAYLLLIKYDGPINTSNHVDTYYHKYNGGAAASQAGALYNAFNTVFPLLPDARTGGYRKQSKKHRRKYSKGRTARR